MVDILKFYGVQVKNSQSLARYDSYKLSDERSAQVCSLLLLENKKGTKYSLIKDNHYNDDDNSFFIRNS